MAIAEAPVETTEAPSESPAPDAAPKKKRTLGGLFVSTPKELRDRIEADAKSSEQTTSGFLRGLLAKHYGLVLAELATAPRKKYNTPEERKTAQKESRGKRNDMVKMLLARHHAEQQAMANGATAAEAAVAALNAVPMTPASAPSA